jgi:hypothetical protein
MPTLTIPDATYRQLVSLAAEQNTTVDVLAAQMLTEEPLLDQEYHAECAAETTPVPTMEEVLAITAKFPGSLVADFIAEREER